MPVNCGHNLNIVIPKLVILSFCDNEIKSESYLSSYFCNKRCAVSVIVDICMILKSLLKNNTKWCGNNKAIQANETFCFVKWNND